MSHRSRALLATLASILLVLPAAADDRPLAGQYGFRTDGDPSRTSCATLTPELAARLGAKPGGCKAVDLASGGKALACSVPNRRVELLVFPTRATCERERKDQSVAE